MPEGRWLSHTDEAAEIEMIYETAPIGMCLVDREMRFRRINRRMAEINGHAPHLHIGKTVREMIPEIADQVEARYRQVIETGKSIEDVEVTARLPSDPDFDHTWLVSDHPVLAHGNRVTGIVTSVQDITLRKALENELRAAERRLAAAHRIDGVAVWEWDLLADRVWWSQETYDLLGLDENEVSPSFDSLAELVHPEDRGRMRGLLKSALTSGKVSSLDYRVVVRGEVRTLKATVEVECGSDGTPLRLIGTSRDVEDQRRQERDAALRRAELEAQLISREAEIRALREELARRQSDPPKRPTKSA